MGDTHVHRKGEYGTHCCQDPKDNDQCGIVVRVRIRTWQADNTSIDVYVLYRQAWKVAYLLNLAAPQRLLAVAFESAALICFSRSGAFALVGPPLR